MLSKIILFIRAKIGMKCLLRTDQPMIGCAEYGYLTVVTETQMGIETVSGVIVGVNGYCGQWVAGFITHAEHLLD